MVCSLHTFRKEIIKYMANKTSPNFHVYGEVLTALCVGFEGKSLTKHAYVCQTVSPLALVSSKLKGN